MRIRFHVRHGVNTQTSRSIGLLIGLWLTFLGFSTSLHAEKAQPSEYSLEIADTASPRNTLMGFIAISKMRYDVNYGPDSLLQRYLRSGDLYPNRDEMRMTSREMLHDRRITAKYFDEGNIPRAIADQAIWRLSLELIEILTRIPLPAPEEIPDAKAMEKAPYKKWTLPGTEISIALIESGSRAGEYLFTRETLERVPDMFERIRDEPRHDNRFIGLYEYVYDEPSGLAYGLNRVIPPRWILATPQWLKVHVFAEPLWRWIILFVLLFLMIEITWSSYRITRSVSRRSTLRAHLLDIVPFSVVFALIPPTIMLIGDVIRVSPELYAHLSLTLWGIFYLILSWLIWSVGGLLAEWIITLERIRVDSTDSQLIRIATRILSAGIALCVLIEGASRMGLPSYSIFAGIGIGGLAFALAGQQTLGNLLGSLIIMFEKPFRIGHSIKTGNIEGTVEHIGFRTSQLRTKQGVVLFVPSSELIRHSIENRSLRNNWRIQKLLHLDLKAPIEQVVRFKEDVMNILLTDPDILPESARVSLTEIGLQGRELLIDYVVLTSLDEKQLSVTEGVLTQISASAERHGILFTRSSD